MNDAIENRKWCLFDFLAADGSKKKQSKKHFFSLKRVKLQSLVQNIFFIFCGLKTTFEMRADKYNIFHLFNVRNLSDEKLHEIIINLGTQIGFVYDIETGSHDVICDFALVVHSTGSFVSYVTTNDINKG